MVHPLERIHPSNLKLLATDLKGLIEGRLWAKILVGMTLGIATGIALEPSVGWVSAEVARVAAEWLALPGLMFLSAIQMVVVPLVIASVIRGIAASGDLQQLRGTGAGLAVYFLTTTVAATGIGVAFAYVIQPGNLVSAEVKANFLATRAPGELEAPKEVGVSLGQVPQQIVSLLPDNPLLSMVEGQMLQVVLFAIVLGVALISIEPESSKPLLDLMGSLQKVSMRIVAMVMEFAPIAVFGLLARAMIQSGVGVLLGLGIYALSVVGALLVLLVLYLLIVSVVGRRNPWVFLKNIRDPQLLAFSTDSSAATMPLTIKTAEERLGIRPSTAQLVIPMGATVNMGGTACYHGLATIFLAQLSGMDLPASALLALIVTSLGSSLGAPATPGAGIMILATVLTSAGVPLAGLSLIIGLDQVLERVRCVLNVSGDLVACVVMERYVDAGKPRSSELEEQKALAVQRLRQGGDVVVNEGAGGLGVPSYDSETR